MAMDMFNLRRCSAGEKVELNSTQRRYLLIQFKKMQFFYTANYRAKISSVHISNRFHIPFHCLVAILKKRFFG